MIYACEKCKFIFERKGGADFCPVCGKSSVREATSGEETEYMVNRENPNGSVRRCHNVPECHG